MSSARLKAKLFYIRRSGPKQWIAMVIGAFTGARVDLAQTCHWCGGPCRTYGGYQCKVAYDRNSCPNRLCRNWIPF